MEHEQAVLRVVGVADVNDGNRENRLPIQRVTGKEREVRVALQTGRVSFAAIQSVLDQRNFPCRVRLAQGAYDEAELGIGKRERAGIGHVVGLHRARTKYVAARGIDSGATFRKPEPAALVLIVEGHVDLALQDLHPGRQAVHHRLGERLRVDRAAIWVADFEPIIGRRIVRSGDIDRTASLLIHDRKCDGRCGCRAIGQVDIETIGC